MKIIIETIPHDQQRYNTCGDYWEEPNGTKHIVVSDLGNDDFAFLVALHEMIEQKLCENRGIEESDITKFDKEFEEKGVVGDEDEPGDDTKAPYYKEHFFATSLERIMAGELNVSWNEYEKKVNSL